MSRLFSDNAFNILGLETSSSQKELIKESKKIIVFIKNEEDFDSDSDLSSINPASRTEASVNDAVQRLNSPIKRIKEYFFWFEIENDDDENNIKLLQDNQYDEALDNWKERAKKSHTAKRNLAIASSILLNHTGYKKYVRLSINSWEDILGSDKFWGHFEKVYELNDEIGTSKEAITEFKAHVLEELSDFYTDVSRRKKDSSIYSTFSSTFGVKGQKVQDEVLDPIFEQINNASEKLRVLNASQDNKLSPQEKMTIKRLVNKIQDLVQEVKDLGLHEDTQSKVMRDKAATAINIVAIDLFTNLGENEKAVALLKIAKSLATGPRAISLINANYDFIKQVVSHRKIVDPINDLIEKEQYEEALELLNSEQLKNKSDKILQTYFTKRIQWCVTALATRDFKEAERLFEADNYEEAETWFKSVYDFIYSYIDNYDINIETLDGVLETLNTKLVYLNADSIGAVSSYRQEVIENSNFDKETSFELPIIAILLDCVIYRRMSQVIPGIKIQNRNNRIKNIVWKVIIYGAIAGAAAIYFSSGGSDSTSTSGSDSTTKSAWQTCSDEYNSLKTQLESIESTLNGYKAAANNEAYNNLIPQQNSLVQQVNSKATECNNLR